MSAYNIKYSKKRTWRSKMNRKGECCMCGKTIYGYGYYEWTCKNGSYLDGKPKDNLMSSLDYLQEEICPHCGFVYDGIDNACLPTQPEKLNKYRELMQTEEYQNTLNDPNMENVLKTTLIEKLYKEKGISRSHLSDLKINLFLSWYYEVKGNTEKMNYYLKEFYNDMCNHYKHTKESFEYFHSMDRFESIAPLISEDKLDECKKIAEEFINTKDDDWLVEEIDRYSSFAIAFIDVCRRLKHFDKALHYINAFKKSEIYNEQRLGKTEYYQKRIGKEEELCLNKDNGRY